MALYCSNPYMNEAAIGMFRPGVSTRAELQPNGPTNMLAGTRMDVAVSAYPVSGFAGLGNVTTEISNLITSIAGGATSIIDSFTGRGAARDQSNAAARIAELQAQARVAEAQSSAVVWSRALPIVAIAGAAALTVGLVVALRK